jgi:penicillin-binding protein 2
LELKLSLEKYLNNVTSDWFNKRIAGVILCIVAAFAILIIRLFYLQILEGDEYRRLSENNSIRLQSVDAPRGLIFDTKGRLLVDNRPSFDLNIIPKDAKPIAETVDKLSGYLDISSADFMKKITSAHGRSSYKPILLKQDIGRNAMASVEVHKFDLPGVGIDIRAVRHYLNQQGASHLIGYLGEINAKELQSSLYKGCKSGDYIGRFGAEKTYENYLRGKRGGRQVEVNAKGQVVRVMKTVPAQPGNNLYLTIDLALQQKAEALLADKVGAVVAMDPNTGEILVMASSPSFDQNDFVSGLSHNQWNALISNPDRPMENKVVQAEYPPASTYKIVTAIAGLETGVIDKDDTFYCPGHFAFGDRVFRCWKRTGHGNVNIYRALAESCDVYFYQVGLAVGVDKLAEVAGACGLGLPTGIALENEARGLIPTSSWKQQRIGRPWQKGETLNVAIGQGYNLTTPLQMLVLVSAIANGGTRYTPQIIRRIMTADDKIVRKAKPVVKGRLPFDKKTIEIVKRGLWEAVNTRGGTAKGIQLQHISISGKTGTAQLVARKEPGESGKKTEEELAAELKPHAWFVAYAPSETPRIAIAVIVEHGEHGSTAAAPIAKEIIKAYLAGDDNLPDLEAEDLNTSAAGETVNIE